MVTIVVHDGRKTSEYRQVARIDIKDGALLVYSSGHCGGVVENGQWDRVEIVANKKRGWF